MAAERSDGELLRAAMAGDTAACNVLVRRLNPRLFAAARGLGLARPEALDVCQVAWMRLWSRLDEIRDPERVGAWLVTTVRHESLRHLRWGNRQVPTLGDRDEFETDTGAQPEIDAHLLETEREVALWTAFRQLPPRCQVILRMFLADPGPTYQEVAAALDLQVGSIGATRGRCIELLRERLRRINGDDEGSSW